MARLEPSRRSASGGVTSARSRSLGPFVISKHEANYRRIDRS
jgi:hypothetical protein